MPKRSLACCRILAAACTLLAATQASAQSALNPQDIASLDLMVREVAAQDTAQHPLLDTKRLAAVAAPIPRSSWSKLHPQVRRTLAAVERKFGRPVEVTSGCRSRRANRLAGGARHSLHLSCMAADFKVAGVSKARLVQFVSNLPGRGGIGTYCRNSIVHVDAGPARNWHQRCR